jgi:hypothetical protein
MIRYLITRHVGLPGVRLSKPGHWGNIPLDDEGAANSAAEQDAGRHPFTIERRTCRAPKGIAHA